MNALIVGSNLTDLGRNSLAAAQQEQDASQATSNRLLQYLAEQNRNRNTQQDLAMRSRGMDQQNAYLQNALAQQGRIAEQQWNTPNATTIAQGNNALAAAKLPWSMGITPEQTAQNALAEKQLSLAQLPYNIYAAGGPPPGAGPGAQAWGQLMVDAAQRKEKNDAALKAANATYLSTVDMWHPMDTILPGDRNTKIANAVRQQLGGAMPEVNELIFDHSLNGGKGGFASPDQAQVQPQGVNALAAASLNSRTNAIPGMPNGTNALLSTNALTPPPTIVNPSTGQRMQLVNGQWQAL